MVYSKRYMGSSKNQLSDRDMLLDLLMTEKYMSQMYNTALMEATNSDVIDSFDEMQHDEHENARLLYNSMHDRGWYNAKQIERPVGQQQSALLYSNKANSSYAVTSGTKNFGNRLGNRRNSAMSSTTRRYEGSSINADLQ